MTTSQNSISISHQESIQFSQECSAEKESLSTSASIEITASSGINIDNAISINENYVVIDCDNSIGTQIAVNGSAQVSDQKTGLGVSGTGSLVMKEGLFTEVNVNAGTTCLDAQADLSIGASIGVEGQTTVETKYTSSTIGAGTSIGDELAIGGGCKATYEQGIINLGVSGDVAVGLGLEVDVSGSLNINKIAQDTTQTTNKIVHDTTKVTNKVVHDATKVTDTVSQNTTKVTNKVVHDTTKVAHEANRAANKLGKNAKKKAKKTKKKLGNSIIHFAA